jgi:Predicted membrane protein
MAAYLFMWGLFTAVMFIGTLRLHVAGQVVFGSLTILFFLWRLAISLTRVLVSNSSPATKEFSADSPRSTPAAQVLNESTAKSSCHSVPVMK